MRVNSIMIPVKNLDCITLEDTVGYAIGIIEEKDLLSLPVVDSNGKFVGVLSKQYALSEFFHSDKTDRQEFLATKVEAFMKTKIPTINKNISIEEAAAMFISSKRRFLPVTDDKDVLLGIVTHQAIFKEYQKVFGTKYNTIVLHTHDYKGILAKLAEIIAKTDGNIKNIVLRDTEVLDIQELTLKIDAEDIDKVVKTLTKNKFDVVSVIRAD